MRRLLDLVGRERALATVAQSLHFAVQGLGGAAVGALHVTCADETEFECEEALHSGFARYLLPPLKFARHSAMRIASLGGRYEWGAVRIAERHYASPAATAGFKTILVKLNAHVARERRGDDVTFGTRRRYDRDSACCGAIARLLAGDRTPFADELRETFGSEGKDRLATLLDESRVPAELRPLLAALVSARLQARKAVLDVQDSTALGPTLFLVVPCVTINLHERDAEIVCGVYSVDGRDGGWDVTYSGLGDDPAAYDVAVRNRQLLITDDQVGTTRAGRDHRALAGETLRARLGGQPHVPADPRLERLAQDVARSRHRNHHHARMLLRAALPVLAEVAPIPVAALMFAEGAAGIHHALRIHKLSREMEGTREARRILDEVHDSIDGLPPDRAEALVELLVRDYAR